jgi:hypothetical protein
METLLATRVADPLDTYRLLATASASYLMLATTAFCIVFVFVVRKDARRYRVVLKLLQAVEERKDADRDR